MFCGFKINIDYQEIYDKFKDFYDIGKLTQSKLKKEMEEKLERYIGKDGEINGTDLQDNWFPTIEADVFISYSHNDQNIAIAIAGWLEKTFELRVFVDSCIWGSADDLLKRIDDKYCKNTGEGGSYIYEKRNYSTSHVHMMLSVAITRVIDKAECVLFLNSPQTINVKNSIQQTSSPWIYYELMTTTYINKKKLSEYREKYIEKKSLNEFQNQLKISYDVSTEHLIDITVNELLKWSQSTEVKKSDALDQLYCMKNIIKYYTEIEGREGRIL